MAEDVRKLSRKERGFQTFGTSEHMRDQAAARRAIEGLSQNDQIIALLHEQAGMMFEQNQLLRYIAEQMYAQGQQAGGQTGSL